ncbi:MAG: MauE/DoxX family redox-associated membrane protein, partial [Chloroflexota bacterium]
SALSLLFRQKSATQTVYRLIGVVEITVALLLLLPPHLWWEIRLATGLAAAFIAYLSFSVKADPGRPCGCLGGREVAVSWHTLVRAGLVLVCTVVGWKAQDFWLMALVARPWFLSLVAVEALLFVGLSPELGWAWIKSPALADQARAEDDCATAAVPRSETQQRLRESAPFRILSVFLKSGLLDHWREGCWQFLCFAAEYKSRKATAVFAVPTAREPYRVRAAIVDEADGTVLLTMGPSILESKLDDQATASAPATR